MKWVPISIIITNAVEDTEDLQRFFVGTYVSLFANHREKSVNGDKCHDHRHVYFLASKHYNAYITVCTALDLLSDDKENTAV